MADRRERGGADGNAEPERRGDPPLWQYFQAGAGDVTARVAIVSTQNEFGIVEYPEDEKVGIWVGGTHYTLARRSRSQPGA